MSIIELTPEVETTADVLDRAIAYIQEHGWCQGVMEDPFGRVCIFGSIRKVGGLKVGGPTHAALDALEELIIGPGLASWNDEVGRTEAEVLDMLRRASGELRRGT